MTRNKFGILMLVLLVLAAVYYFATTERSGDLVLVGTVDANEVMVSARIQGRIQTLYVDEGSVVHVGEPIADLDTAELQAQKNAAEATLASLRSRVGESRWQEMQASGENTSGVLTAEANLQSAKSQLAEAQATLVRVQQDNARIVGLANAGVASQQQKDQSNADLDAAQAHVKALQDQVRAAQSQVDAAKARTHATSAAQSNVAATQAQMDQAQAQLIQAETQLSYAHVVSPVNGTVSVRAARQGEVVNPGQAIVTVVDYDNTWVRADVPETAAGGLGLGDVLKVRMPGGEIIEGTLILKQAEGDFATQRDVSRVKRDIRTIGLKLKIDNSRRNWVPGMTATVLVPPSKTKAQAEAQK